MTRGDIYPMLEYAADSIGSFTELLRNKDLDITQVRMMCFAKPIPTNAQLADHHYLTANAPVISHRLKDILEGLNLKQVQLLPTIVRDKKGKEHEGYYIVHVLNLIKCMDKEKSEWTPHFKLEEKASDVQKLVLDNDVLDKIPLEERLVFALWENSLEVLYHRSVIEKMLELNPTGLTVHRLSGYDQGLPFIEAYMENLQS